MDGCPLATTQRVQVRSYVLLQALELIRPMRGGSQSKLMRCSDEKLYVVKFKNNPQGIKILVNELVAGRLAAFLRLPAPEVAVVNVGAQLIKYTGELAIHLGRSSEPCVEGLQFGSQFAGRPPAVAVHDFIPTDAIRDLANLSDFVGMLVFDKWTCNTDGRQVVYSRRLGDTPFEARMIDQGFCFGECNWNFPDAPLRGVFSSRLVYESVRGMDSFEPWLTRIETEVTMPVLESALDEVPSDWYGYDRHLMEQMMERLYRRRTQVRDLVESTRKADESIFPNWKERYFMAAPAGTS